MAEPTRHAANYGRQSHGKKKSVAEQLTEGRAALIESGTWPEGLIRDYQDETSASRYATRVRVGWPTLLADIGRGEVGLVALWEASRGDRTVTSWSQFLDLCRSHGVTIYSTVADTVYDPRKPQDWKVLITDGVDSEMEAEKIRARARRGIRGAANEGKPHGKVAFGFRRIYDDRTRKFVAQVPDTTEYPTLDGLQSYQPATVVRWLYRALLEGVTLGQMCVFLNEAGVPCPARHAANHRGSDERQEALSIALWAPTTILELLKKKSYIGVRMHQGREIPNAWEPLVEDEDFYAVRNALADPSRRTNKGGLGAKYLCSFIARCPCGAQMASTGSYGKEYKCRHMDYRAVRRGQHSAITRKKLEPYVEWALITFLTNPESARRMAESTRGSNREAAEARALALELRTQLDSIRSKALDPNVRTTTWRDYEDAQGAMLPAIEAAEESATLAGVPEDIREWVGPAAAAKWATEADILVKRRILRALADITVTPTGPGGRAVKVEERVKIEWRV